jgi:hypothetical protein
MVPVWLSIQLCIVGYLLAVTVSYLVAYASKKTYKARVAEFLRQAIPPELAAILECGGGGGGGGSGGIYRAPTALINMQRAPVGRTRLPPLLTYDVGDEEGETRSRVSRSSNNKKRYTNDKKVVYSKKSKSSTRRRQHQSSSSASAASASSSSSSFEDDVLAVTQVVVMQKQQQQQQQYSEVEVSGSQFDDGDATQSGAADDGDNNDAALNYLGNSNTRTYVTNGKNNRATIFIQAPPMIPRSRVTDVTATTTTKGGVKQL